MTLTPDQARARLAEARRKMHIAAVTSRGREGFDQDAGVAQALLEVISLLEDALA